MAIKRVFFTILVTLTTSIALQANQRNILDDASYKQLAEQVEYAKSQCDSIDLSIINLRQRYMQEHNNRNAIAKELSSLEQRAVALKMAYNKALTAATTYEQKWIRSNIGSQSAEQESSTTTPQQHKQQHATIHNNSVVAQLLTPADIAILRKADKEEQNTIDLIADYMQHYDKMVMLQLEYERTDRESKADSIIVELEQERKLAKRIEANIEEHWQSVIDNKNYIYNLAMEKENNLDVVTQAESKLSAAMQQCSEEQGAYESDVLASYYRRKLYMLEYEEQVAKALHLTMAKDSLQKARTQLVGENYQLPIVRIKRRAFIEFEPLKVIKPTIYNYKNPIPQTKIYDFGTVFRIRIGIFTNRPNLSALRGITPLSYTNAYHNGKYAYYVGGFRTLEEAREGVLYLRKIGFRDPIPVVWVDGKYYSDIAEWQKQNQSGFNIEISGATTLPPTVKAHISLRDESLQISRIGETFVIGTFTDKESATKLISEINALEPGLKCEINELKKP